MRERMKIYVCTWNEEGEWEGEKEKRRKEGKKGIFSA
jgi:hypothetical protein